MDIQSFATKTCLVLLVIFCTVFCEVKIHRPGRHVCTTEKMVMKPVRRVESYCRPYYHRDYLPCPNDPSQFCSSFRLTYRTAQRTMFHMIPQREQSYSCCPGWTGYSSRYHGCLQPICERPCEHGGYCNQPGQCACPRGWNGTCCEEDKNECLGDHGCQQICTNSAGSYNCSCYEGFTLQDDRRTCKFCLSCLDEYKILVSENARLKGTVDSLRSEMGLLNRGMDSITEKVKRMSYLDRPEPLIRATTPEYKEEAEEDVVFSPEIEETLVDLTNQVIKLEQTVGLCYCEADISRVKSDMYKRLGNFEEKVDKRLQDLEFEQVEPPVEVIPRRPTLSKIPSLVVTEPPRTKRPIPTKMSRKKQPYRPGSSTMDYGELERVFDAIESV